MTTHWIATRAEFAALAATWDEAVETANAPDPATGAARAWGFDNPFLLSGVLLHWSAAFLRPGQFRVWTCWEGTRLIGGLPLFLTRRRHGVSPRSELWRPGWNALHPIGLGFANLTEPFWLGEPGAFAPALAAGLRQLGGWSYLSLPHTRAPLFDDSAERSSRLAQMAPVTECGARIRLDAAPFPDAGAYLATREADMRHALRRRLRRSEEAGGARLERETQPARVDELIEFQLRFNGPYRYEPEFEVGATQEAWAEFCRTMLRRLLQWGWLDPMALRIGGRLAAVGFGFRHGRGHKSLLISYDPAFRGLGPGFLYYYRLIERCLEEGEPYIDLFANGGVYWKRIWCNEFPSQHTVWVFNRTLAGRALHLGARLYWRGWR